jgi:GTP-binding protein
VRVDEGKSFVVADIPGLIEGAHLGKGLGLQFLRHIQRTKVLVFLLEATRGTLKEDLAVLTHELQSYDKALPTKTSLIVISKIDVLSPAELATIRRLKFGRLPVYYVSAVAGIGIPDIVQAMGKALVTANRPKRRPHQTPVPVKGKKA